MLVLTNAMRPMMKRAAELLRLQQAYGRQLVMRVSIDHYDARRHTQERGPRSWEPMVNGLTWLKDHAFAVHVAGRNQWQEDETTLRLGFANLFAQLGLTIDAWDEQELLLFPEMDESTDVPEITTDCWAILDVDPNSLMCASSRMIVKRKGAAAPEVVACTLLSLRTLSLASAKRYTRQVTALRSIIHIAPSFVCWVAAVVRLEI